VKALPTSFGIHVHVMSADTVPSLFGVTDVTPVSSLLASGTMST